MKRHNFRLLSIRSLAAGLLLLTLAPAAMAQMQAPMGATSPRQYERQQPQHDAQQQPQHARVRDAAGWDHRFAKRRPDAGAKYVWESSQKF